MSYDPFNPNSLYSKINDKRQKEKLRIYYQESLDHEKIDFIIENGFCSECKIRHNSRVWFYAYIQYDKLIQKSYCNLCLINSRLFPKYYLSLSTPFDKDWCDFKKKLNTIIPNEF